MKAVPGARNRYALSIAIIAVIVLFICIAEGSRSLRKGASIFNLGIGSRAEPVRNNAYDIPLIPAPKADDPLAGIGANFITDESFVSHLPLIIIDTGGRQPPISTRYLTAEDRRVGIPGLEPYVEGSIAIIDTGGMNTLQDAPVETNAIRIKRRGNGSMDYEKAQYLVKLVTPLGEDRSLPLLGMGSETEWVLNGSMADKSMVRNYLAYLVASQFMPYTPESRYCEVFIRENGQYRYEGIYLLIESVKRGANRIAIHKYNPAAPFPSYLVRRDRYDENANTLDTWLTRNNMTNKYVTLVYPSQARATAETLSYVGQDISQVEKILYSNKRTVFSTYSRYLDIDSFVDYFIFNEFFGSYDAGKNSTYMYKEAGGKLHIGPVWDLDNAMDNYIDEPLNIPVTAFQASPYFERLILDARFLSLMEKRYAELRREILSDTTIYETIDAITAYLGPAIDREWIRWNHVYTNPAYIIPDITPIKTLSLLNYVDNDGYELIRETKEHRQEIYRLKTSILQHGKAIGAYFRVLEASTIFNTGIAGSMDILLGITLLIFSLPLIYIMRR
ncbi:hypothetical protein AGMMS49546_06450 [Spirochaetia bacterium]|nr:hypothetical protein AGMMS49546_06450 [Spirochaetia bacterium]